MGCYQGRSGSLLRLLVRISRYILKIIYLANTISSRSPWQADTSSVTKESIMKNGRVNHEGYVNVAQQMGLSGERGTGPSYDSCHS